VRNHVDLPTVDAMTLEWQRHPPVHRLVAGYLGYKAPAVHTPASTVTDIDDLLPNFGNVPIRQVAPLDTTAFDAQFKEAEHG
jgi:hypothetical protein